MAEREVDGISVPVCPHCGQAMVAQPLRREVFGRQVVTVRWMSCVGCAMARVMSWSLAGSGEAISATRIYGEPDDVEAHALA